MPLYKDIQDHVLPLKSLDAFLDKLSKGSACIQSGSTAYCYRLDPLTTDVIQRLLIKLERNSIIIQEKVDSTTNLTELRKSCSGLRNFGLLRN